MKVHSKTLQYRISKLLYDASLYLDNSMNSNLHKNGEEHFLDSLIREATSDLIIFDIGSNKGQYIDMVLKKTTHAQIHSFEPMPYSFGELLKKGYNGRVTLNNTACSDVSGSQIMYYDNKSSKLASLYPRDLDFLKIHLSNTETVSSIRLDEYLLKSKVHHINLLKVDVEGHEKAVLDGLGAYLNPIFIDYIQFEYGGTNLDSMASLQSFYSLLENNGFKIAKLMPNHLSIRNYEPYLENFRYSNYIAISKRLL